MDIEQVKSLIQQEMQDVDQLIMGRMHSEIVLINQVGRYIINSGGKRLRPMLVFLSSGLFGYQGKSHVLMAAVIEFIHTATLLHDDVVDESDLRRGRETVNNLWGNATSVLVGDFLYSRAFQMMVEPNKMKIMNIMAETTNIIAEGEILQLLNAHNPATTEEKYMAVIQNKTAQLFEAATVMGAVLTDQDEQTEQQVSLYGKHLGTLFQLIDDVLDYTSSAEQLGKNVGDDLAEGKPTLPLIFAMANGSSNQADVISSSIKSGGLEHIDEIINIIKTTGAIEYTQQKAQQQADLAKQALQDFPHSQYKQAMIGLADFCIQRVS
jgi:octaprenyl-diphosphate synthase